MCDETDVSGPGTMTFTVEELQLLIAGMEDVMTLTQLKTAEMINFATSAMAMKRRLALELHSVQVKEGHFEHNPLPAQPGGA